MFKIIYKQLRSASHKHLHTLFICAVVGCTSFCINAANNGHKSDIKCNANATVPGLGSGKIHSRVMLFAGGDSISKFYRIPALCANKDGVLIALADRRLESNKDLPGPIDVVARSSYDGGRTWTPAVAVALHDQPGGGGYGDPALGIDSISGDAVCVMTHGNGLWESEMDGNGARICVNRSSDGGLTWSKPVDITDNLYSQTTGVAPIQCVTGFATSGRMLTTKDGTMWFVLVARHDADKKWGPLTLYACRSTDGGHTWALVPVPVDPNGDESKMVELPDGRLMMSIRNREKQNRKFAFSSDGGKSWSAPQVNTTLPDPACNGDIILLSDGTLLHSIPNSPKDRTKVSLFRSYDQGTTWQPVAEVCPVFSCYSSIEELAPGKIGILTEEASSLGGLRLWFSIVDID